MNSKPRTNIEVDDTDISPPGDEMGFSALDPCECGSGKPYCRCTC